MRVLHLLQKPHRRGAEIFASDLSVELRRRSVDVRSIYLYPYSGSRSIPLHEGDRVLAGVQDSPLERFPGVNPRVVRQIRKEIRSFDPDIVQINGARSVKYGTVVKALAGPRARWKLVYRNIDNPSFWNPKAARVWVFRHILMPQIDGILGVSQLSLAHAISMYDLQVPALWIPRSIDPSAQGCDQGREQIRAERGAAVDDVVVLFVASLEAQKRPDRLARILKHSFAANARLRAWIVGDGSLRERTEAELGAANILDRCSFFGYQDHVGPFYAGADLFLLTSDTEGIPGVALEAGYAELATVATDVGGVSEAVIDGETGLLAQATDEGALLQHLLTLCADAELRKEMGSAAKRRVCATFTIDQAADRYLEFCEGLLEP